MTSPLIDRAVVALRKAGDEDLAFELAHAERPLGSAETLKEPLSLRDYVALIAFREIIKNYNAGSWPEYCCRQAFNTADGYIAVRARAQSILKGDAK